MVRLVQGQNAGLRAEQIRDELGQQAEEMRRVLK
jgi:hypothetical protein